MRLHLDEGFARRAELILPPALIAEIDAHGVLTTPLETIVESLRVQCAGDEATGSLLVGAWKRLNKPVGSA